MPWQFAIKAQPCTQTLMRILNLLAQRDKAITAMEMRMIRRQSRISIAVADFSCADARMVAAKMRSIVGVTTVDLIES